MKPRKVKAVRAVHLGHAHVDFEDGSMLVLSREELKKQELPKVGGMWPLVKEAKHVPRRTRSSV